MSSPTIFAASANEIFSSWPVSALVDGVKIGSGNSDDSFNPGGSLMPQTVCDFWYSFQPRTGEVTAHDAFDGQRFGISSQSWSAARVVCKCVRQTAKAGQRFAGAGEQMVRLERFGLREPEIRNLREHLAFARNAVGHDDVESREAVGGDEQQAVAEVEDFAHLAALELFDAR